MLLPNAALPDKEHYDVAHPSNATRNTRANPIITETPRMDRSQLPPNSQERPNQQRQCKLADHTFLESLHSLMKRDPVHSPIESSKISLI